MHRRTVTVLLGLALLSFVPRAELPAALKAGAAKADITPKTWPQQLVGSFSRRLATKAFDPLHARALVLDDGQTRLAIVVVDNCLIPRHVLDEAKRRAEKRAGVRADRILVSATHTHSAPAAKERFIAKVDPEYLDLLQNGIADAIREAVQNLEPAEFGWGTAEVPDEVFNRRWHMKDGGIVTNPFGNTNDTVRMNPPRGRGLLDKPAGPTDPVVSVVSVRAKNGRPICLLANYSLHYVGGVPSGGVSADYFGAFCRIVEEELSAKEGRPAVGILSNGTSGDINNINFTDPRPRAKPFERIKAVAQKVADAALETYQEIEHRSDVSLGMTQRLLTLQKRQPTPQQVANAKEFLAAPEDAKLPRRAVPYARWTLDLAEPPHEEELVLQAVRIGDLGIVSIPCEVFCEIGLELRERSPLKHTFTIELANGHYGYLPTPRQHALGGYETWLGTCILEEQASVKITEELVEMLDEVAK